MEFKRKAAKAGREASAKIKEAAKAAKSSIGSSAELGIAAAATITVFAALF